MLRNRTVTFHPSADPTFHSSSTKCVWVWVDKKYYVSFLRLCARDCCSNRRWPHSVTPFGVQCGLRVANGVMKKAQIVLHGSRQQFLPWPSFATSQTVLEKEIQKNCIFGSLGPSWSKLIAFPSLSTSLWQPARWQSHWSSLDKYLVPLVAV